MPWIRNTTVLWALYVMIVRLSATHSIYIAPPSSIGYSVCKALVVQRIEQIRPKDKIEVQFFARAQLRARFKGRWSMTRAGDRASRLARAENKTAIDRCFVLLNNVPGYFSYAPSILNTARYNHACQ